MEIFDNYLHKYDFIAMRESILRNDFPWFYSPFVANLNEEPEIDKFQFYNTLCIDNESKSNFYNLVDPLIKKINPSYIYRVKVNLGTRTANPVVGGLHSDTNFNNKTAIFYLNNNNGYTIFEDGSKIDSIENRLVVFDSHIKHSGVSQTNSNVRCVINLNYR